MALGYTTGMIQSMVNSCIYKSSNYDWVFVFSHTYSYALELRVKTIMYLRDNNIPFKTFQAYTLLINDITIKFCPKYNERQELTGRKRYLRFYDNSTLD